MIKNRTRSHKPEQEIETGLLKNLKCVIINEGSHDFDARVWRKSSIYRLI
jgi:hypothetical protein